MAEENLAGIPAGQFQSIPELLSSSPSLQIAIIILIVGLAVIITVYRKFSRWIQSQRFYYRRPHLSRLFQTALLPFFAIALISSINGYVHTTSLFGDTADTDNELGPKDTFAKILATINILVIGYTVSHLIPIFLNKREKSILEIEDFEKWKSMRGFKDDKDDLFHKLFEWVPPKNTPGFSDEEFQRLLQAAEGRKELEGSRTPKGVQIGTFKPLVSVPFEKWKESERQKYDEYYEACISGNNESGQVLRPGVFLQEIYPIDSWREEKRLNNYDPIIPGSKPPVILKRKEKELQSPSIKPFQH